MERIGRPGLGRDELIVLFFACAIFLVSILSPPALVDDVDAVQAQIARNMLDSGDWVTARLDGVPYLEKSPLKYWMIAVSYAIFGVHDWAARIPVCLAAVLLCWVTMRMARWALGRDAGFYAGLTLSTSIGLFLFTRILIPDVILTLAVTLALWSLLRALDPAEPRTGLWAMGFWAFIAIGILLKGLIGALFPMGIGVVYLLVTGEWRAWRRLRIVPGMLLMLAIAAPWHVLATIRNPPLFDFTMHSESGSYRGFFWFYFFNEHLLRFLNKRYPRDYNTVPRALFWLFHLVWFFPWSLHFPAAVRLKYRDSRLLQMALCWIGFVLAFFTLSTTQEYYSMPCYPAIAVLLGAVLASTAPSRSRLTQVAAVIAGLVCILLTFLLAQTRGLATPGDISQALTQNPDAYTLSLGHMTDLTFQAFAYLRVPLALAAFASLVGAVGGWIFQGRKAYLSLALMMMLFFQAARLAMIAFNPYLGSKPIADALLRAPEGKLIIEGAYYELSSVFFYTNKTALLLNGRRNNLEYGSYAPGAPHVFIGDADFERLWKSGERYYMVVAEPKQAERLHRLVPDAGWRLVAESGGKQLVSNALN